MFPTCTAFCTSFTASAAPRRGGPAGEGQERRPTSLPALEATEPLSEMLVDTTKTYSLSSTRLSAIAGACGRAVARERIRRRSASLARGGQGWVKPVCRGDRADGGSESRGLRRDPRAGGQDWSHRQLSILNATVCTYTYAVDWNLMNRALQARLTRRSILIFLTSSRSP